MRSATLEKNDDRRKEHDCLTSSSHVLAFHGKVVFLGTEAQFRFRQLDDWTMYGGL
jgi:hypothetical protein